MKIPTAYAIMAVAFCGAVALAVWVTKSGEPLWALLLLVCVSLKRSDED